MTPPSVRRMPHDGLARRPDRARGTASQAGKDKAARRPGRPRQARSPAHMTRRSGRGLTRMQGGGAGGETASCAREARESPDAPALRHSPSSSPGLAVMGPGPVAAQSPRPGTLGRDSYQGVEADRRAGRGRFSCLRARAAAAAAHCGKLPGSS